MMPVRSEDHTSHVRRGSTRAEIERPVLRDRSTTSPDRRASSTTTSRAASAVQRVAAIQRPSGESAGKSPVPSGCASTRGAM
jgi:hypothetical protein